MKSLSLSLVLGIVLLAGTAFAVEPAAVPAYLQKISVTVRAGNSGGSGVTIIRKIDGKDTTFVLTAHHVIDGLRRVETKIIDGREVKKVIYDDAQIVQEKVLNGRTVGDSRAYCKVFACSEKHDIALLQVRWDGLYSDGAVFVLDKSVTPVGTELFHCGSPAGQELGHNSLTPGIIASNGRLFNDLPYDQTTVSALPGSSGGVVARKSDGLYVGTLTLGLRGTDTFNYIVPIRRTLEWAEKAGLRYIFDPAAAPLTQEQLDKVPLETNRVDMGTRAADSPPTTNPSSHIMILPPPLQSTPARPRDSILKRIFEN